MFPDVKAQERFSGAIDDTFHQRVVLVGRRADAELAVGVDAQPSPTTSEARDGRVGELFLEFVEASEGRLDRVGQGTARLATPLGAEILPEQAVVEVPAAVVPHAPRMSSGTVERFITSSSSVFDFSAGTFQAASLSLAT